MQSLISVVIPVYNREATIKRSVESVLKQTYKNIEIIIIDDGSSDGTVEVLRELEQTEETVKIFIQDHRGANAARNLGIEKSKGEFIAFQDSDDEWLPDKLEKQLTYMVENNFEVSYCPFFLYEDGKEIIIPENYQNSHKYEKNLLKTLKCHNVVSTQTLVIHRNVISDIGIFDENMPRYQDYEYVIRIVQKKRIGYVNKPLVKVYRTINSISNDNQKLKEAEIKLLTKHNNFFDMETCLKNRLKKSLNILDQDGLNKWMEHMNDFLNKYSYREKINMEKMVRELLYQEYKLRNISYSKEYKMRVENLHSQKFAIYGAGKTGKKICRELLKKGLIPQCFLVTKKIEEKEFYGIPVYLLSEWDEKDKEIIIGVSLELQDELIENLIHMGYMNYFRCQ